MILKDKAALEAYKKEREQNRDKSLDAHIEDVVVLDYEPADFSWPALYKAVFAARDHRAFGYRLYKSDVHLNKRFQILREGSIEKYIEGIYV